MNVRIVLTSACSATRLESGPHIYQRGGPPSAHQRQARSRTALCPLHLITADDFIWLVRFLSPSPTSLLFFLVSLFARTYVYFYMCAH